MAYALSCLGQQDIVLKEKQSEAIKSIYEGKDVFTWLPTGYRKSRYQLLLFLFEGHGVCAAIFSGLTGVSKALLATERDIAQGRLRFLFTAPGAIVGNSRWKQILLELSDSGSHCVYKCVRILFPRTLSVNDYIIVRYFTAYTYYTEKNRCLFAHAHAVVPRPFPPPSKGLGTRLFATLIQGTLPVIQNFNER